MTTEIKAEAVPGRTLRLSRFAYDQGYLHIHRGVVRFRRYKLIRYDRHDRRYIVVDPTPVADPEREEAGDAGRAP